MMRKEPHVAVALNADPAGCFEAVAVEPSSVDMRPSACVYFRHHFGRDESYLRDANHTLLSLHMYVLLLLQGRAAGRLFVRAQHVETSELSDAKVKFQSQPRLTPRGNRRWLFYAPDDETEMSNTPPTHHKL